MDINEVDIMIGELRQEFSETLIGLQREIIELNDKIELILEAQSPMKTIDTIDMTEADFNMRTVVENSRIQDDIIIEDTSSDLDTAEFESRSFSKADQVGDLLNKGYSVDEICEKLQIGRGEVLLIQKLYQS